MISLCMDFVRYVFFVVYGCVIVVFVLYRFVDVDLGWVEEVFVVL